MFYFPQIARKYSETTGNICQIGTSVFSFVEQVFGETDGSLEEAFKGTAGVDVWRLATCTHTKSSQFVLLVLSATPLQMGRNRVHLDIRNLSLFTRTSLKLHT